MPKKPKVDFISAYKDDIFSQKVQEMYNVERSLKKLKFICQNFTQNFQSENKS